MSFFYHSSHISLMMLEEVWGLHLLSFFGLCYSLLYLNTFLLSLGVLWNRCLRDLAIVIFCKWAKEGNQKSAAHVDSGSCQCLYEAVFEQFNDEDLEKLENTLEAYGLDSVLQEEEESTKHLESEFAQTSPGPEFIKKASGLLSSK